MTRPSFRFWAGPRGRTRLGTVILAGVLAVSVAAALAAGAGRPGWPGAVAFAAAIAGISGIGGWIVARRPTADPAAAIGAALLATALRLFPPLAALAWLATLGTRLRGAGADGLVALMYLIMLASTIVLHVAWRRAPGAAGEN